MDKDDQLDLIADFENISYECDFIILTSYNFDPIFFDSFLLPKLQDKHPDAEIIVIIDADQYSNTSHRFTKKTGNSYELIPATLPNGVFHPKIFLFLSTGSNLSTLYISSSNLTSAGMTNNAELITKFDYNLENSVGENLIKTMKILKALDSHDILKNLRLSEVAEEINHYFNEAKNIQNEQKIFLHNIERPILIQALGIIGVVTFDEITAFSPFLTPNSTLLDGIFSAVATPKFVLKIQENNHNLADLSPYKNSCYKKNVKLEIFPVSFIEDENRWRRIHAKYLYFTGQKNFVLSGSPNFTESALLRTIQDGNFEVAILHQDIDFRKMDLAVRPIENGSVQIQQQIQQKVSDERKKLKVFSANYLGRDDKIIIYTEKIQKSVTIQIFDKNENLIISGVYNLDSGKCEITLGGNIPFKVIVRDEQNCIMRRVFYDEDYPIKEFGRGKISIQDLFQWAYKARRMDVSTLLSISRIIMSRENLSSGVILDKEDGRHRVIRHVGRSLARTNNIIKKLTRLIDIKKNLKQQRKLQEISIEDADELESDSNITREIEEFFGNEDVNEYVNNHFIRLSKSLRKNYWDKDNLPELVVMQLFLIESYVALTEYLPLSQDTDEAFLSLFMKNMEGIKGGVLSEEYQKMFADILIRFCYKRKKMLGPEAFKVLSSFFSFTHLVRSDFFIETKDKISEQPFDNDLFSKIFASLAIWATPSENAQYCIKYIGLQMRISDLDYEEFFYQFIHGLKKIRQISSDSIRSGISQVNFTDNPILKKRLLALDIS